MRIAAVSDLHGHLPTVPECDLLLIGGDICPVTDHRPEAQAAFLNGPFRNWLGKVPAKQIIGVAGNHDLIYERHPWLVPTDLPWTYLEDAGTTVDGLNVYGSPWQPVFHNWAFNAGDTLRKLKWERIPDDTHVLVLHGPPYGHGDETLDGRHVGCLHLAERIRELPGLKLVVFGHIHCGYGLTTNGDTLLANCSHVDERYQPANPIPVFEVDL